MDNFFTDDLKIGEDAPTHQLPEEQTEWAFEIEKAIREDNPFIGETPLALEIADISEDGNAYGTAKIKFGDQDDIRLPFIIEAGKMFPTDLMMVSGKIMPLTEMNFNQFRLGGIPASDVEERKNSSNISGLLYESDLMSYGDGTGNSSLAAVINPPVTYGSYGFKFASGKILQTDAQAKTANFKGAVNRFWNVVNDNRTKLAAGLANAPAARKVFDHMAGLIKSANYSDASPADPFIPRAAELSYDRVLGKYAMHLVYQPADQRCFEIATLTDPDATTFAQKCAVLGVPRQALARLATEDRVAIPLHDNYDSDTYRMKTAMIGQLIEADGRYMVVSPKDRRPASFTVYTNVYDWGSGALVPGLKFFESGDDSFATTANVFGQRRDLSAVPNDSSSLVGCNPIGDARNIKPGVSLVLSWSTDGRVVAAAPLRVLKTMRVQGADSFLVMDLMSGAEFTLIAVPQVTDVVSCPAASLPPHMMCLAMSANIKLVPSYTSYEDFEDIRFYSQPQMVDAMDCTRVADAAGKGPEETAVLGYGSYPGEISVSHPVTDAMTVTATVHVSDRLKLAALGVNPDLLGPQDDPNARDARIYLKISPLVKVARTQRSGKIAHTDLLECVKLAAGTNDDQVSRALVAMGLLDGQDATEYRPYIKNFKDSEEKCAELLLMSRMGKTAIPVDGSTVKKAMRHLHNIRIDLQSA